MEINQILVEEDEGVLADQLPSQAVDPAGFTPNISPVAATSFAAPAVADTSVGVYACSDWDYSGLHCELFVDNFDLNAPLIKCVACFVYVFVSGPLRPSGLLRPSMVPLGRLWAWQSGPLWALVLFSCFGLCGDPVSSVWFLGCLIAGSRGPASLIVTFNLVTVF